MDLGQIVFISRRQKPLCEFSRSRERTPSKVEGWMLDHNPLEEPR